MRRIFLIFCLVVQSAFIANGTGQGHRGRGRGKSNGHHNTGGYGQTNGHRNTGGYGQTNGHQNTGGYGQTIGHHNTGGYGQTNGHHSTGGGYRQSYGSSKTNKAQGTYQGAYGNAQTGRYGQANRQTAGRPGLHVSIPQIPTAGQPGNGASPGLMERLGEAFSNFNGSGSFLQSFANLKNQFTNSFYPHKSINGTKGQNFIGPMGRPNKGGSASNTIGGYEAYGNGRPNSGEVTANKMGGYATYGGPNNGGATTNTMGGYLSHLTGGSTGTNAGHTKGETAHGGMGPMGPRPGGYGGSSGPQPNGPMGTGSGPLPSGSFHTSESYSGFPMPESVINYGNSMAHANILSGSGAPTMQGQYEYGGTGGNGAQVTPYAGMFPSINPETYKMYPYTGYTSPTDRTGNQHFPDLSYYINSGHNPSPSTHENTGTYAYSGYYPTPGMPDHAIYETILTGPDAANPFGNWDHSGQFPNPASYYNSGHNPVPPTYEYSDMYGYSTHNPDTGYSDPSAYTYSGHNPLPPAGGYSNYYPGSDSYRPDAGMNYNMGAPDMGMGTDMYSSRFPNPMNPTAETYGSGDYSGQFPDPASYYNVYSGHNPLSPSGGYSNYYPGPNSYGSGHYSGQFPDPASSYNPGHNPAPPTYEYSGMYGYSTDTGYTDPAAYAYSGHNPLSPSGGYSNYYPGPNSYGSGHYSGQFPDPASSYNPGHNPVPPTYEYSGMYGYSTDTGYTDPAAYAYSGHNPLPPSGGYSNYYRGPNSYGSGHYSGQFPDPASYYNVYSGHNPLSPSGGYSNYYPGPNSYGSGHYSGQFPDPASSYNTGHNPVPPTYEYSGMYGYSTDTGYTDPAAYAYSGHNPLPPSGGFGGNTNYYPGSDFYTMTMGMPPAGGNSNYYPGPENYKPGTDTNYNMGVPDMGMGTDPYYGGYPDPMNPAAGTYEGTDAHGNYNSETDGNGKIPTDEFSYYHPEIEAELGMTVDSTFSEVIPPDHNDFGMDGESGYETDPYNPDFGYPEGNPPDHNDFGMDGESGYKTDPNSPDFGYPEDGYDGDDEGNYGDDRYNSYEEDDSYEDSGSNEGSDDKSEKSEKSGSQEKSGSNEKSEKSYKENSKEDSDQEDSVEDENDEFFDDEDSEDDDELAVEDDEEPAEDEDEGIDIETGSEEEKDTNEKDSEYTTKGPDEEIPGEKGTEEKDPEKKDPKEKNSKEKDPKDKDPKSKNPKRKNSKGKKSKNSKKCKGKECCPKSKSGKEKQRLQVGLVCNFTAKGSRKIDSSTPFQDVCSGIKIKNNGEAIAGSTDKNKPLFAAIYLNSANEQKRVRDPVGRCISAKCHPPTERSCQLVGGFIDLSKGIAAGEQVILSPDDLKFECAHSQGLPKGRVNIVVNLDPYFLMSNNCVIASRQIAFNNPKPNEDAKNEKEKKEKAANLGMCDAFADLRTKGFGGFMLNRDQGKLFHYNPIHRSGHPVFEQVRCLAERTTAVKMDLLRQFIRSKVAKDASICAKRGKRQVVIDLKSSRNGTTDEKDPKLIPSPPEPNEKEETTKFHKFLKMSTSCKNHGALGGVVRNMKCSFKQRLSPVIMNIFQGKRKDKKKSEKEKKNNKDKEKEKKMKVDKVDETKKKHEVEIDEKEICVDQLVRKVYEKHLARKCGFVPPMYRKWVKQTRKKLEQRKRERKNSRGSKRRGRGQNMGGVNTMFGGYNGNNLHHGYRGSNAQNYGQRSMGQRPTGKRPTGRRPTGQRPTGQRPTRQRPTGQRPTGQRPTRQRPTGQRPTGQRPTGQRSTIPSPPTGPSWTSEQSWTTWTNSGHGSAEYEMYRGKRAAMNPMGGSGFGPVPGQNGQRPMSGQNGQRPMPGQGEERFGNQGGQGRRPQGARSNFQQGNHNIGLSYRQPGRRFPIPGQMPNQGDKRGHWNNGKSGKGRGRFGKGKHNGHKNLCDVKAMNKLVGQNNNDKRDAITCSEEIPNFIWKVQNAVVYQGYQNSETREFEWQKRAICQCAGSYCKNKKGGNKGKLRKGKQRKGKGKGKGRGRGRGRGKEQGQRINGWRDRWQRRGRGRGRGGAGREGVGRGGAGRGGEGRGGAGRGEWNRNSQNFISGGRFGGHQNVYGGLGGSYTPGKGQWNSVNSGNGINGYGYVHGNVYGNNMYGQQPPVIPNPFQPGVGHTINVNPGDINNNYEYMNIQRLMRIRNILKKYGVNDRQMIALVGVFHQIDWPRVLPLIRSGYDSDQIRFQLVHSAEEDADIQITVHAGTDVNGAGKDLKNLLTETYPACSAFNEIQSDATAGSASISFDQLEKVISNCGILGQLDGVIGLIGQNIGNEGEVVIRVSLPQFEIDHDTIEHGIKTLMKMLAQKIRPEHLQHVKKFLKEVEESDIDKMLEKAYTNGKIEVLVEHSHDDNFNLTLTITPDSTSGVSGATDLLINLQKSLPNSNTLKDLATTKGKLVVRQSDLWGIVDDLSSVKQLDGLLKIVDDALKGEGGMLRLEVTLPNMRKHFQAIQGHLSGVQPTNYYGNSQIEKQGRRFIGQHVGTGFPSSNPNTYQNAQNNQNWLTSIQTAHQNLMARLGLGRGRMAVNLTRTPGSPMGLSPPPEASYNFTMGHLKKDNGNCPKGAIPIPTFVPCKDDSSCPSIHQNVKGVCIHGTCCVRVPAAENATPEQTNQVAQFRACAEPKFAVINRDKLTNEKDRLEVLTQVTTLIAKCISADGTVKYDHAAVQEAFTVFKRLGIANEVNEIAKECAGMEIPTILLTDNPAVQSALSRLFERIRKP